MGLSDNRKLKLHVILELLGLLFGFMAYQHLLGYLMPILVFFKQLYI